MRELRAFRDERECGQALGPSPVEATLGARLRAVAACDGATTRWGSLGRPQLPIHDGKNEAVLLWGHGPPWSARSIGEFEENQARAHPLWCRS